MYKIVELGMRFSALMLLIMSSSAAAQVSSGTAFAVASGLLVTNQHVVDGCASIEVIASDGRRPASVVDAESQIDLALLRVYGLRGGTARLRNPRNIRLGESVNVFGFPLTGSLSSDGNFTSGVVSALRGLRDAAGELQITAPVQPGNSGGPLMDASGLIVGVVQSKLDALRAVKATGDIPQNVNFAISLEVLADFLAKNKVIFRDAVPAAPLDTARIAQLAQSFTYRVECRTKAQPAVAPPSVKPQSPSNAVQDLKPDWIADSITGCKVWNPAPKANETISWTGDCRNGFAQGRGVLRWYRDGEPSEIDEGAWTDGKMNGKGVITNSSGVRYEGVFKDGILNR